MLTAHIGHQNVNDNVTEDPCVTNHTNNDGEQTSWPKLHRSDTVNLVKNQFSRNRADLRNRADARFRKN